MINDRSKNVLTILVIQILLIVSLFTLIPTDAYSSQPPVDLTSYYVGTIGQPRNVDPTRAYDTASGELIFNVYEPLIFFSDKPVPAIPSNYSVDMLNQKAADLTLFNNVLCTNLAISPDGETWTFTIDTTIPWQPWQAANGTWYYQFLTAADVEYSFKRMLVQDMTGSPSWMICLPLCGYTYFNNSFSFPADEATVAGLINTAITRAGNTVSFHMQHLKPWPQIAFKQILAQTWGCICNRDFCIEHGCWAGSFASGWSDNYRQQPSNSYTPLDSFYAAKSKYASANSVPAMCGTGPYIFNYWVKAALEYQVYAWESLNTMPKYVGIPATHYTYRGGWVAPGTGPHSLRTIIVKGTPEWTTRKMLFLGGDTDVTAVPRANMYELLNVSAYNPTRGVLLYYNSPRLSNDVALFVLNVSTDTPYMPKVVGVGNVPDFFGDARVRRAFCQALGFDTYLSDAWWNEAVQPCSWWVDGLAPDYLNKTLEAEKWGLNTANIQTELTNAGYWATGFETYLVYNLGNAQRQIACEMIRDTIQSLNTLRPSLNPFVVNVVGVNWSTFQNYEYSFYMPMFFTGWLVDFADADDFARPYMRSDGDLAYYQLYGNSTIDALIDSAINMPDGQTRNDTYQHLQWIYHMDSPGLPIAQALVRRWSRTWVRGWYLNQLYPGDFFYDLYKTTQAPTKTTTYVIVEASIIDSLETYLERYLNDLRGTGDYAQLYIFSGNAVQLRSLLKDAYSRDLKGCVLVGDLPIAWYEMNEDWGDGRGVCHEEFPTDLFYMDLDGTWTDTDSNGKYDQHTGNRLPEIWVGRIKASNMAENEISLIQNYFDKDHNFRTGALTLPCSGLTYVDDDWVAAEAYDTDYAMSLAYDNRTLISNKGVTNNGDYLTRLAQDWSFVQVMVHGAPDRHHFKINGQWDGVVYSSGIRSINPHAFFYNIFSCSTARYCDADYIDGWYIFSHDYGLAAISSTKTGGMLFFDDFYREFSQKTLGESFLNWLTKRVAYEDGHPSYWYSSMWYYGMVILGDPTLYRTYSSAKTSINPLTPEVNGALVFNESVRGSARIGVSAVGGLSGYSSIQEAINAANPGDTIEVSAGIYNEHITVNKTVNIVGQDSDSVFVMTNETGPIILVIADGVQIRNLTIKALPIDNLTASQIPIQTGMAIYSNNNIIESNKIIDCNIGVQLSNSNGNKIESNMIQNSTQSGIDARESRNNNVTGNRINGSLVAVFFFESQNTTLTGNELINNTYATIQYAIADIAVPNIEPSKTVVGQNYPMSINVKVCNQGNYSVTSSLALYANETALETFGITLANGSLTTITFDWDTARFAKGNYTIWAYAEPVSGETYTADNTYVVGTVYVGIPGDVNADGIVELMDFFVASNAYNSSPGKPNWNPNADINDDSMVEMMDFYIMSQHYNEHEP
jgi:parallel beta-helix repeat protein